jgi:hypothetical protein
LGNDEVPLSGILVPDSGQHFGVELDLLIKVPFLRCLFDVVFNFSAWGVKVGPVGIGLEREGVDVGRDVTG